MKRYIVVTQCITPTDDTVFETEHSMTYLSMRLAAEAQLDHTNHSDYITVGFRIVELESKDEIR